MPAGSGGAWLTVPAGSAPTDPAAPLAVISLLGQAGVASHAVHVNALQSQLNAGTPITAHYRWDFGDPAGEYNVLPGWNAGHVYDAPGTYTSQLTFTATAGTTYRIAIDGWSGQTGPITLHWSAA